MVEEGPLMAFQRTAEEAQLEPNEGLPGIRGRMSLPVKLNVFFMALREDL